MSQGSVVNLRPAVPAEGLVPRLRSSLRAVNADGFFTTVAQALRLEMRIKPPPDGAHPFFVRAFPKERLAKPEDPFDGITWRVLSSVPAPLDNAGGRIPRKPMNLDVRPDPEAAGYNLLTQVWLELATVEFTVWSRSGDTCASLLNWFHLLLMRYANLLDFFEGRGIDQFQFVGRGEDSTELRAQQELYFGTLTYQFRVQTLSTVSTRQLEQLVVSARIDRDQLTFTLPADADQ